jgi:predicted nuclease of predicted toxin-antitoxin system
MIFFADEGLDFPLVDLLRKYFTVIYAAEEMTGAPDEVILQQAFKNNCILITKDKDFGEIIIRNKKPCVGIILIRIEKLNLIENCVFVTEHIRKYASEFINSFTVIQEDKIRIRSL